MLCAVMKIFIPDNLSALLGACKAGQEHRFQGIHGRLPCCLSLFLLVGGHHSIRINLVDICILLYTCPALANCDHLTSDDIHTFFAFGCKVAFLIVWLSGYLLCEPCFLCCQPI